MPVFARSFVESVFPVTGFGMKFPEKTMYSENSRNVPFKCRTVRACTGKSVCSREIPKNFDMSCMLRQQILHILAMCPMNQQLVLYVISTEDVAAVTEVLVSASYPVAISRINRIRFCDACFYMRQHVFHCLRALDSRELVPFINYMLVHEKKCASYSRNKTIYKICQN